MPYASLRSARGEAGQNQLQSLCALATWRLARGDYRYAEAAIRRLRGTVVTGLPRAIQSPSANTRHYAPRCSRPLGPRHSACPTLGAALELADTAARTYDVGQSLAANLVVARIAEAQGDLSWPSGRCAGDRAATICFPTGISRPSCTRRAVSPRSPATRPALSGRTSTTSPFDRIQNRK